MPVGCSVDIAIALQPLIDGFAERFRYAITYPAHKASIKFKLRTAVLHHESADVLCVSVMLANWRISCELITVPIKTHGAGSKPSGLIYEFMAWDAWRLASGIHTSTYPFPWEGAKSGLYCSNSGASASSYSDSGNQ